MKNIHVLPTDKPSRLRYNLSNVLVLTKEPYRDYGKQVNQHIYITSDEEIKEGDWCLDENENIVKADKDFIFNCSHEFDEYWKKIILTTDQDLINDDVTAIDDEFLEWFVKNPSCDEVEVADIWKEGSPSTHHSYQLIIPQEEQTKCYCGHTSYCDCGPEEPKQETLEEIAKEFFRKFKHTHSPVNYHLALVEFAKWQQERSYSLDEIKTAMKNSYGIKFFSEHKFLKNLSNLKKK